MDTRTGAQNRWLERFGNERLFRRPVSHPPINTLPKLLWLKEHRRRSGKAWRFLLYEDF
jgi:sugar (pentulose or hexulose) kinase